MAFVHIDIGEISLYLDIGENGSQILFISNFNSTRRIPNDKHSVLQHLCAPPVRDELMIVAAGPTNLY